MKYGIAIFPSKKMQDVANSLRKRYDPHYAWIPPHLTLKAPFELDDEKMPEAVAKIREIARDTSPFPLKVYKVGSFHPANNVIYLRVQENEEMVKLHDRLNEGTLRKEEPYNFVPHITVAQDLADLEHSDVFESLKMRDIHHEEIIDRFQLMYQLENGAWTVYETFHLGRED